MHISEGVLSLPVLVAGAAGTTAAAAYGLREMKEKDIPKTAIIAAALFVVSLINLPLGPTSVHLLLNGIAGVILGWKIFPVFLLNLFLQAILFQFGGLTVIGVNTIIYALPGLISFFIFKITAAKKIRKKKTVIIVGFTAGFTAVIISAFLLFLALYITEGAFREMAAVIFLSYLPLAVLEGSLTAVILLFLLENRPEIIKVSLKNRHSIYEDGFKNEDN